MSEFIGAGTTARIRVAKPEDMVLSFELTMTLREWQIMAEDLEGDEGDARKRLRRMICEMIASASKAVGQTYATTGWSGFRPTGPDKEHDS